MYSWNPEWMMSSELKIQDSKKRRRKRVLIVDDEEINRQLFEAMLASFGHETELAADGREAVSKAGPHIDLILMDVIMPGMNGYEAVRSIRANPDTRHIPVIMITALSEKSDRLRAVEAGANDFISKPIEKLELRVRSTSLLKMKEAQDSIKNYNARLEDEVVRRTTDLRLALERISRANLDTIQRLVLASQRKDDDTGSHIVRMSNYVAILAGENGLSSNQVHTLKVASTMHDIGKIGIPDSILLKPGKLNPDEWKVMKSHTTMGSEILKGSSSEYLQIGEVIAATHHEQWDGGGYPLGLKRDEIPIEGRITALADVFDALTSARTYRRALNNEKALEMIRKWKGNHFDPKQVDVFFKKLPEIMKIQEEFSEEHTPVSGPFPDPPTG